MAICQSGSDCPPGAECRHGDCLCNGLSLAQQQRGQKRRNWKELSKEKEEEKKECSLDLDCAPVLGCLRGRCVCIPAPTRPPPSETWSAEENGLTIGEGGGPALEWDLALGEESTAGGAQGISRGGGGGPILPGTFCDHFSGCGPGAKCVLGRCQCQASAQRLAFVNGTTQCVHAVAMADDERSRFPKIKKWVESTYLTSNEFSLVSAVRNAIISGPKELVAWNGDEKQKRKMVEGKPCNEENGRKFAAAGECESKNTVRRRRRRDQAAQIFTTTEGRHPIQQLIQTRDFCTLNILAVFLEIPFQALIPLSEFITFPFH
jgi:hypothetical protein